jgi:hypothetical protein
MLTTFAVLECEVMENLRGVVAAQTLLSCLAPLTKGLPRW